MRNVISILTIILTVNVFATVAISETPSNTADKCKLEKDKVEELKTLVRTTQTKYDGALAESRFNVTIAILRELGPTRTTKPSKTNSESANNLKDATLSESRRVTLKRTLNKAKEDLEKAEKALNECLYDICISCNENVPDGQPYYHYVFCYDYMYIHHVNSYPTGKYWSCNPSEVETHKGRTCTRSKYGSAMGERCGQTYRNCNPRVCRYQRSDHPLTLYCNENSY